MKKRFLFLGAIAALVLTFVSCNLFAETYDVTFENNSTFTEGSYIKDVKLYIDEDVFDKYAGPIKYNGKHVFKNIPNKSDVYIEFTTVTVAGSIEIPVTTKTVSRTIVMDTTIKSLGI